MSAIEIIEQIERMPPEEQQRVLAFVHAAADAGALQKSGQEVTAGFKRAADEMFTTNAELFRKFAQ